MRKKEYAIPPLPWYVIAHMYNGQFVLPEGSDPSDVEWSLDRFAARRFRSEREALVYVRMFITGGVGDEDYMVEGGDYVCHCESNECVPPPSVAHHGTGELDA